jgi:hypothetical protein
MPVQTSRQCTLASKDSTPKRTRTFAPRHGYFLEVVKARAVTALCRSGPERERELGRFDADVEHVNEAIAARCS